MIPIVVITSLYKSEPYLANFLENVSLIDGLDEIQVVLNLSSPNTEELDLVRKYRKILGKSLKVIINKDRVSIAEASNQVIQETRSKYLAIWNVDDQRTSRSLISQKETLDLTKGDICIGPYKWRKIRPGGMDYERVIDHQISNSESFLEGMLLGPFFMIRRSILTRAGLWDEQFKSGGDFDWAVRLARAGKVVRTDENLGTYLDLAQGASTSISSIQPVEREVVLLRYGAYKKVDRSLIIPALSYDLRKIKFGNNLYDLSKFFHNYNEYILSRKIEYQLEPPVSLEKNTFQRIVGYLRHVLYRFRILFSK